MVVVVSRGAGAAVPLAHTGSASYDTAMGGEPRWFSANVRAVVMIEGEGVVDARESVFLVRALDFDDALPRVVEVARARLETEYRNGEGQLVRWRLTHVLTLDVVRDAALDGAEIWTRGCAPAPSELALAFDATFEPGSSTPDPSGI